MILMCQWYSSTAVTNIALWGEDVHNGEAMHVCGEGILQKSLYLSLDSAVNLKPP